MGLISFLNPSEENLNNITSGNGRPGRRRTLCEKFRKSSSRRKWWRSSRTPSTTCSGSRRRTWTNRPTPPITKRRPLPKSTSSSTLPSAACANSTSHSNTAWLPYWCRTMAPAWIPAVPVRVISVMAYNDSNTDGVVTVQREVGDNIVVMTVFANLIWFERLRKGGEIGRAGEGIGNDEWGGQGL